LRRCWPEQKNFGNDSIRLYPITVSTDSHLLVHTLWSSFVQHKTIESILNDRGLAKVGDAIVNLCYSLAKTLVLGRATGEKVQDIVLAKAIRATSVYRHLGHKADAGTAADAYEALISYLWMTGCVTIDEIVQQLVPLLNIDLSTNKKQERVLAAEAFRLVLTLLIGRIKIPNQ
jgi:hypothetical protein